MFSALKLAMNESSKFWMIGPGVSQAVPNRSPNVSSGCGEEWQVLAIVRETETELRRDIALESSTAPKPSGTDTAGLTTSLQDVVSRPWRRRSLGIPRLMAKSLRKIHQHRDEKRESEEAKGSRKEILA